MPFVHRLLVTLRTLMEDEPEQPKSRRRKPNNSNKNSNRKGQTTALILTFRDLFRSGGLNIILDDIEVNRRQSRKNTYNCPFSNNPTNNAVPESALCVATQASHMPCDSRMKLAIKDSYITSLKYQDETSPLLQEESTSVHCTDLVSRPLPIYGYGLFNRLPVSRRKHSKPSQLTVPLNPDDENKTVETLKKVLKWSPRKQNATTFAVSLPTKEEHAALAVVENAVNRVKEDQLRKKKRRFLWLKLC